MTASDYEANIDNGTYNVDILMENIEYSLIKGLSDIQVPKQTPPLTYVIDLKKLKEAITINGWLLDETSESALTKKNNLRSIMQSSGTLTLTWGTGANQQQFTVNINKATIKETPVRIGDEGSMEKGFSIQIQFIIGTHKG